MSINVIKSAIYNKYADFVKSTIFYTNYMFMY